MFGYSTLSKDVAYRSIARPCVEYACVMWYPHTAKDCALLDTVQNHAARWISYDKSLGLGNFEVDKILQGLCIKFKLSIPFPPEGCFNLFILV